MNSSEKEKILAIIQKTYSLHHARQNLDTFYLLQKEIVDDLKMLTEDYEIKFVVKGVYHENGRPKGFFTLSEEEGKCCWGFGEGYFATYDEEEAKKRAIFANSKSSEKTSSEWFVEKIVVEKRQATPQRN